MRTGTQLFPRTDAPCMWLLAAGLTLLLASSSNAGQVEVSYTITPSGNTNNTELLGGTAPTGGTARVRWTLTGSSLSGNFANNLPGTLLTLVLTDGGTGSLIGPVFSSQQHTEINTLVRIFTVVDAPGFFAAPSLAALRTPDKPGDDPSPCPDCGPPPVGLASDVAVVRHRITDTSQLSLYVYRYYFTRSGAWLLATGNEVSRVLVPEPATNTLVVVALLTLTVVQRRALQRMVTGGRFSRESD